ncbi:MAG: hypothetical protein WA949_07390 [Phormidesmis sp.]
MAEPSLIDVFGAGATQDAASVTIQKSALSAVGLSATATNTAESLLCAIVLLAKNFLSESAFESNLDQSVTIVSGLNSITPRDDSAGNFTGYRQIPITINFHQADTFTLDPDGF